MKKSNKKFDIDCLGLGIMPIDLFFQVENYPEAGTKIDALKFYSQGGGPVPNVVVGLSRLGYKSALITAIGNDPFGEAGITELKKEKVVTKYMVHKKGSSDLAAGMIEKKSGDRTMILSRKINVQPKDLRLDKLPIPRIIHLDGRDLNACIKLARWGRKNGSIISFDIGSVRNDVSPIFKYVDQLIVADQFAFHFTKTKSVKLALKRLQEFCPGTVVITLGKKGSAGYENGEYNSVKAYKVNTVDATGAGDAFHTGYLYGLLNRKSFPERLQLGSAVAAIKCRIAGARAGLPKKTELFRFIKNHKAIYA